MRALLRQQVRCGERAWSVARGGGDAPPWSGECGVPGGGRLRREFALPLPRLRGVPDGKIRLVSGRRRMETKEQPPKKNTAAGIEMV